MNLVSFAIPSRAVSEDGNITLVARFNGHEKSVKSARASTKLTIETDKAGLLNQKIRTWLIRVGVATLFGLAGFFL